MGIRRGPNIVQSGLVLSLDAGNIRSYPGSGTTWFDVSGTGTSGTLTNGATYSSANKGVIGFDGINDYVTVPNTSNLNFGTGDFTVLVWVGGISSYPGGGKTIIRKGSRFDNNIAGWGIMWAGSPEDLYFIVSSDSTRLEGRTISNGGLNGWAGYRMLGMQRNGTNWNQIVDTSVTNLGSFSGDVSGTSPVDIAYNSLYGTYLNNSVAQVLIYNRALSASEILQNYNMTKSRFGK